MSFCSEERVSVQIRQFTGPQGEKGERGPQGEKGEQGPKGCPGVIISGTEPTDPEISVWIDPEGGGEEPWAAQIQAVMEEINALHPLAIQVFFVSPAMAEKGSTVSAQSFSYSVNRPSAQVTLEGVAVSGGSAARADTLTTDRSYTLTAVLGGVTKTATAKVAFVAPVYYGVSGSYAPENATVLALNRVLTGSRARTFTVNAGDGQYILYALPEALGVPVFKVGGFEGGFELAGTFDFTNASGHTESYRLYRSSNAGLGATTVAVS